MHTQRSWEPRDQNKMQNSPHSAFILSANEKLLVMEALDHIYVTRQYKEMGSCTVCKKISIKKCPGCSTFYCSSECQTFDWPKHRLNCPNQRESLSDRNSFSSGRRMCGPSSVNNFNDESIMITNRSSPFTALAHQLSKKSGNLFNESRSLANLKTANKQHQTAEERKRVGTEGTNESKGSSRRKNVSPKTSWSSKKSSPEEKKPNRRPQKSNNNNNNQVLNNVLPKSTERVSDASSTPKRKKQPNVKKLGKMEVVATYRESQNRYWVMAYHDLKKYEEIQRVLNTECQNYKAVEPEVGLVCGCTFAHEWFRGRIASVTPEVTVHFIDYGNVSSYDVECFRRLPDNLRSVPGLAFLIEFDVGTPNQYQTEDLESLKFTVEETSRSPDGVPRVRITEGVYGTAKVPTQPPAEGKKPVNSGGSRSVMDEITATSSGMLFFVPGEGLTRFASIVPDNHIDSNICIEKVLNIDSSSSKPYQAEKGDLVLVTDKEGNEQRGKVVMKLADAYYVQLIDCGNVISSDNVFPLPEDLRDLIELGVKINVEEVFSEEQSETCFFTVTGESTGGKWPCLLTGTKQQKIAKVTLEKPESGKAGWEPQEIHLKSGSTVEISSVSSPNSFYVRPVDVETEQKFLDMNMEMIQSAPRGKSFDVPPSPGELCCAKFQEDNCFYRGVVNSVEKGKLRVLFVDFGNEQLTDLRDVKPLPDSLRQVPFFAVRVDLKNVSEKPWNNMIKDYVGRLTSENVELTLTYVGSLSNGVTLKEKVSGVVVNDFIEKTKDRSPPVKSEIFLDDDLRYTEVSPGSTCTLAVLYVSKEEFETNQTFWATNADAKNFNHVNVELSTAISEYCENVSVPYKPSYRELCLAEFEGCWYRAICMGSDGDVYKVFFVDFGNFSESKPESIRKMQKRFIEAPALAMNCTVKDRERLKSDTESMEKAYERLLGRINNLIEGVKVVKFEEDTFVLEIPGIGNATLPNW